MADIITTTGTAAPAAGGEPQNRNPQQAAQQSAAPTAEQRTAFQRFWDSLFGGGKEETSPGSQGGRGRKAGTAGRQDLFRGRRQR